VISIILLLNLQINMYIFDSQSPYFIVTLEFLLNLIGGAGGLIIFFIAVHRYIKEQTWKLNEFVANEIRVFLTRW